MRGGIGQAGDEIGQLVAPVEVVGELGQVAACVAPVAGMIGSVDGPLDVAEQGVHPGQARRFAATLAPAVHARLVLAARRPRVDR